MSDIVEIMARAQCSSGGFDPDERMPNDGKRWQYYVPSAAASVDAISKTHVIVPREPTEAMIEAGRMNIYDHSGDTRADEIYVDMIKAAEAGE